VIWYSSIRAPIMTLIEQADLTHHHPPPGMNPFILRRCSGLIQEDRTQPMTLMHLVPSTRARSVCANRLTHC
jgi:hypothetical protein